MIEKLQIETRVIDNRRSTLLLIAALLGILSRIAVQRMADMLQRKPALAWAKTHDLPFDVHYQQVAEIERIRDDPEASMQSLDKHRLAQLRHESDGREAEVSAKKTCMLNLFSDFEFPKTAAQGWARRACRNAGAGLGLWA